MARRLYGINIDPIITDVVDVLIETGEEELNNQFQSEIALLKKESALFLKTIIETQEKIRNLENLMLAQKKLRTQIRKELKVTGRFLPEYETDNYRKNKEELSSGLRDKAIDTLYEAAFKYHEVINNVLGQEVKTMIVLQDKEGNPLIFEMDAEKIFNNKILSYEESSKTARLTARFKVSLNQMQNAGIKAIDRDDLNIKDNLNVHNLNIAYKDILYRYDTYKQLVLWLFPKSPKTWNKGKISARGDIAEAYAMFFLKKAEYDFQSSNKEENIHYFMILGVQEVDNVSGLLQGDISSGQYEYAIKAADASFMSVQQIIDLAKKIVMTDNYNLMDLKNYKKQLASKKQKIRNPITQITEKELKTLLDPLMKSTNKT